jgi:hypothetical protein
MKLSSSLLLTTAAAVTLSLSCHAYVVPRSKMARPLAFREAETRAFTASTTMMTAEDDAPNPESFREAEVLGLRLMQEGNFEEALVGTSAYLFWVHLSWDTYCLTHARLDLSFG